jgi:Tannase and feruloyl esterase
MKFTRSGRAEPRRSYVLRYKKTLGLLVEAILILLPIVAGAQENCKDLRSFTFPNTTITDVASMPGGAYVAQDAWHLAFNDLPPWCQVTAKIRPTPDSDINVQVWLPIQRYNSRYLGAGNGGYGGSHFQSELAQGVANGFATSTTDMGTSPSDGVNADNLVGHREKWSDFGWRATHVTAQFSKALIDAFYGSPAKHSYFAGCSTGGQQALMEAERFPDDYDGILAGAPAFNRTRLHTVLLAQYSASHKAELADGKASALAPAPEPELTEVAEPAFVRALREAEQTAQYRISNKSFSALSTKTGYIPVAKLDTVNAAVLKQCLGQGHGPMTDA